MSTNSQLDGGHASGYAGSLCPPYETQASYDIQIHVSNSVGHDLSFSRLITPELCGLMSLFNSERAQGMPDAGRTHGPPATKKAGGSHHRFSRNNRHSPRDGFNAYT